KLFDGADLTAWAFAPGADTAVFGFADGTVRTATIKVENAFVDASVAPAGQEIKPGASAPITDRGVIARTPQGLYRLSSLDVQVQEPAKGRSSSPVPLLDQTKTTSGAVVAVLSAAGDLRLNTVREHTNLLSGEVTLKLTGFDLPYREPAGKGPPMRLFLSAV